MLIKSLTLSLARAVLFVGAGFLVVNAVQADGMRDRQIDKLFKAADTNADGKLTLAEAQAKPGMPKVAANFATIDADKKGYVTLAQIKSSADSAASSAKSTAKAK